jgi:hypothetical protein
MESNPKTKYCVLHQIETDPPCVLLITSKIKKAINCIIKDVMASEAYSFKKSEVKRCIKEEMSFHAGIDSYDNYYIVDYEQKI